MLPVAQRRVRFHTVCMVAAHAMVSGSALRRKRDLGRGSRRPRLAICMDQQGPGMLPHSASDLSFRASRPP